MVLIVRDHFSFFEMEVTLIQIIIEILMTVVIAIRFYWITDKVNFLLKDTFNHLKYRERKKSASRELICSSQVYKWYRRYELL